MTDVTLQPGETAYVRAPAGETVSVWTSKDKKYSKVKASGTAPTPPPVEPPPSTDPPGWKLAFEDQFTTWDPSRYFVYPSPWKFRDGTYSPEIISSNGSNLRIAFQAVNGVYKVAAFIPIKFGDGGSGNTYGMRVEFRMRADSSLWEGVPLLWPKVDADWPGAGEIDGPEGRFDKQPDAFMHRAGATTGSDQDWYPYTGIRWADWHTYVTEWVPGQYVEYRCDGALIGRSTARIPSGPMHFVMQTGYYSAATNPNPAPALAEIDYLKVWVP